MISNKVNINNDTWLIIIPLQISTPSSCDPYQPINFLHVLNMEYWLQCFCLEQFNKSGTNEMLSSMNSLALIYLWCLIKHLSTSLYFIHVSFQSKHSLFQNCIFRANLFITDSFLGFLCSMYSLTGSEAMAVTKSFATFLTCLTFLCSMNSLMLRKTWTQERLCLYIYKVSPQCGFVDVE